MFRIIIPILGANWPIMSQSNGNSYSNGGDSFRQRDVVVVMRDGSNKDEPKSKDIKNVGKILILPLPCLLF